MDVRMVPLSSLQPPKWGCTYLLRPDKMLLASSMRESGWLQPLVVRLADSMIIDGTKRWDFASSDEKFAKRHGPNVPVVYHDVDEIDAMILHVRLNRARGNPHPVGLSKIVKQILVSRKYGEVNLANILELSDEEFELLRTGGLLKSKNWQPYTYSRAWVPIEVPSSTKEDKPVMERPPNPDR